MKDDYSDLDWSKAKKNPYAKKLKELGKYKTISRGEDFDEITEIEVDTGRVISQTKVFKEKEAR